MSPSRPISIEWENVANSLSETRAWLNRPDVDAKPYRAIEPFQETIVALARAVNASELRPLMAETILKGDGATEALDRFLSLKLGGVNLEQSLHTAQKILNNATYFRRARITSLEDARTCLEAIVSLVNIAAELSDLDPKQVTDAG